MTSDDYEELDFSTVLAASVHDMKNSVGMLVASLASVIDEQPPENSVQALRLGTLHYEASRINNELVQLLTLYRMQNRHLPLRVDQHYVVDILEESLARNHMLIEAKHVTPEIQCDDELQWYFDSDLLGSLVQNVLVNCARYTQSRILLSAEVTDNMLVVTIADDGPGYPASMRESPAASVEQAAISSGETHLGLYFAQRIAAMHRQRDRRGYIRLENGSPLGGGVFRVFLP
jgi:signal transduction histidine kinase